MKPLEVVTVLIAWIVLGVAALVVVDSLLGRLYESSVRMSNLVQRDRFANVTHVFLPGILARCREQIDPLLPAFDDWGNLVAFDYRGEDFDIGRVADSVVHEVKSLLAMGGEVIIHGISLGGTVAAKVARRLRADVNVKRARTKFVLYDTPSGSQDFVPMPKGLGWIFQAYTPGPLVSLTIGKLALFLIRGKPKDENIVYPSDPAMVKRLMGENLNVDQYRGGVKHRAKVYQTGHSPRVWWRQLGAMHQAGREDLLDGAFDGFKVVYVACLPSHGKNETVDQPQAFESIKRQVPHVHKVVAPAQHCAFLEAAPVFHDVMQEVRRQLDA